MRNCPVCNGKVNLSVRILGGRVAVSVAKCSQCGREWAVNASGDVHNGAVGNEDGLRRAAVAKWNKVE